MTENATQLDVPQLVASGAIAAVDGVIARVWVPGPGDSCQTCVMRPECPDQTRCLHLVASAGISERTDGPFRRFPIGAREVGRVPLTLEPWVANDTLGALGLADPAWLIAHDVRGFAAAPLADGGRCAGVLAVFSRALVDGGALRALEAIAALGARALAAPAAPRATAERPAPAGAAPFEILRAWDDIERDVFERVLAHTGGRVSGAQGAATILRMKPTTLQSRLKKLGVRRPRA